MLWCYSFYLGMQSHSWSIVIIFVEWPWQLQKVFSTKVETTPCQSWELGFLDLIVQRHCQGVVINFVEWLQELQKVFSTKAETTFWCLGRDTTSNVETGFLNSVSLADQKVETTPKSKLGIRFFWTQCHLLINRWRQSPHQSWELGFLEQLAHFYKYEILLSSSTNNLAEVAQKVSLMLLMQSAHLLSSKGCFPNERHPDQKVETTPSKFGT